MIPRKISISKISLPNLIEILYPNKIIETNLKEDSIEN